MAIPAAGNPTDPATVERNIRFLYIEIAFSAFLGGIVTFNSAFVVRLGGSKELIALLLAVPALVGVVAGVASAGFLERRRKRKMWLFNSLLLFRIGYGMVVLIPLLFPINTAAWLVLWIIGLSFPAIFFTNGFHALLGDLVPERRRAFVFSRRSIIWSVGVVVTTVLAGAWLDLRVAGFYLARNRDDVLNQTLPGAWYDHAFPVNYQLLYLFGFVTVLGSSYFLSRLHVTDHVPAVKSDPAQPSGGTHPETPIRLSRPMARMLTNLLVYQFGLALPAPLFSVFFIETLKATDSWFGINGAAGSAGVVVGYMLWERLLRNRPFTWGQRYAPLLTWVYPIGIALVPSLTFILLINFLVNLAHPGVELSNFNVMLKLAGKEHRTVYMSWYNAVINVSGFVAPLLGVWLATQIGFQGTMLFGGLVRIAGGLLFKFNHVEEPAPEAALV